MSMAINLKKETACVLEPANILKLLLHTPFNIISCNEKFYTIFINLKTKFKIFSLKKSPLQKIRLNRIKKPVYDKELKFFPWIR